MSYQDYTKYDNLILVNKLSLEQKRAMANFLAQFAAIVLGSGFIVPVFSENLPGNIVFSGPVSILSAGIIVVFMLWLFGKGKK